MTDQYVTAPARTFPADASARDAQRGASAWAHAQEQEQRSPENERMAKADELRESRARYAGIINSAMDAIITIDSAQRILLFNAAAEKMFHCSAADVIGQPIEQFIPPRFRRAHREYIHLFGRTGVTNRAMGALGTLSGMRADGEEFPMEASISQLEESGQKIYTVILRDITQRKQAEQEIAGLYAEMEQRVVERTAQLNALNEHLAKKTAELEAAYKELEAFSYSVSHDLRAPLRHIAGFVELLQKDAADSLDDKQRRFLNIIADAAARMGKLIDDLLAFSRVGRTELIQLNFDMRQLVQQVISEFHPDVQGRQISWMLGPLPQVHADRALLALVWTNLISNALKYTRPRAHAEIEIGFYRNETEHVFFIRDNGVGFDMKYIDKVFGVFQRLHSTAEFEGTGIGLANVRRIIQRHGGRVWVESAVNEGATFYFTLPSAAEE